jgi:uncharacterized protein (DUF1501 family)
MKRRTLLHGLVCGSGALAYSTLASSSGSQSTAHDHVLILLDLQGGNDGLNTVVPIEDRRYQNARPSLAISSDAPMLDRGLALHPALSPLMELWHQKRLGVALGVGWTQPNRSHFKASDQWATARLDGQGAGWLARAFDAGTNDGPLVALHASGCAAMEGGDVLALQLSNAQFRRQSSDALNPVQEKDSPILRRLLELEFQGELALNRLRKRLVDLPNGLNLPRGVLGQQVGLALRLIGSGICPPVLQLALGGFDTHANQPLRHARALKRLAESLVVLDFGLKQMPRRPKVTLMVSSEFGRSVRENASRGTDHGSASVAFLYGDDIPHPFLGRYPDLDELDQRGGLIPSLTPTSLYQSVLRDVRGVDAKVFS